MGKKSVKNKSRKNIRLIYNLKRKRLFEKKVGKLLLSHRYNLLPLLCSHPGGVQKELVVKDLPATKVELFLDYASFENRLFKQHFLV